MLLLLSPSSQKPCVMNVFRHNIGEKLRSSLSVVVVVVVVVDVVDVVAVVVVVAKFTFVIII